MPNHLTNETSPYLLQHVNNSVDWYPWGPEALEKAIREDKPIFLSIGYSACHWCHVMAHESFENQEIASFMNEYFVNIKVDREERPDLDSIYMSAVVAMTGQGGWPMSVFLTTDCQPFYGGTYFPPVRRHGLPSFSEVLQTVARLWRQDRSRIIQSGIEITRHLKLNHPGEVTTTSPLSDKNLEMAALHLAQTYDWEHGGWGRAPKFPQPMAIEFLLLRAARGDRLALDITNHALTAMAKGGVYDVIGGGFARYSTDDRWLIPHFEKMLYDNAQLSRVYLHAYLITGEEKFRRVCEETLDFIKRELMSYSENKANKSGIFSSLDADSDGEEGKYYLWTLAEIQNVLSQAQESAATISNINWNEFFTVAYNVTEKGNFEGETILQRALDDQDMAKIFGILPDLVLPLLDQMHKALFEARSHRHRPGIDDKVLVAWNALALMSFAEAARYLKRPDYLEIARKNAKFQLSELHPGDRLLRAWRNGRARHNAYLEDYSGLILGLIALYQSDPDPFWFSSALTLADEMLTHFSDPNGGFFDTRQDHDRLIIRPKDLQDNATPSGNALAATALLQLSVYTGNMVWRNEAEKLLGQVQELASRYPVAFSQWLCAIDFALNPAVEVAILGEQSHPNTHALIDVLWSRFRSHCLAAISTYPPPQDSPALLQDRPLVNGLPTAYVCQNFVCQQPVISPAEFASQLE